MSRILAKASLTPILALFVLGAGLAAEPLTGAGAAHAQSAPVAKPTAEPQTFATAAAAATALIAAAKAQDKAALLRILGSGAAEIVNSGDEIADRRGLEQFAQAAEKATTFLEETPSRVVLIVGAQNWPLPIPLVKRGDAWTFDTAAGKEEIISRRIGENELTTIDVMRAFVTAQKQYAEVDREGDGIKKFARRIKSRPGKRDGLHWETKSDEDESPLGELVAEAEEQGYRPGFRMSRRGQPYYGYYFKLITRQGAAAPGGRYDYIVNGHMIAGFAMIAYPAQWGVSGVMTFIVNQQGIVYQQNLGVRTGEIAANMAEYNPDSGWAAVKD